MIDISTVNAFGGVSQAEDKVAKAPAIGIDLGTTNTCVSIIREGSNPEVIPIHGRHTLSSCVMWKGGDNFIVGREAYENRGNENVIYSVKRLMGSGEVVTLKYEGEEITLTPEEVSAKILEEAMKEVNKTYKYIKDVVVTVPAKFSNEQVKATRDAIKLAGLNNLNILREPTAASLTYNLDKIRGNEEYILVYDLGGGTFDISLVRISKVGGKASEDLMDLYGFEEENTNQKEETILTVIANEGDTRLGGDDLDIELYKLLTQELENRGINTSFISVEDRKKYILTLEKFKKLSAGEGMLIDVDIELQDTARTKVKEKIYFGYNELAIATEKIYAKTKKYVSQIINEQKNIQISKIVLVGGSTKNKFIRTFLERDFPGFVVNSGLDPDEAVAKGAAIQAKRLKFGDEGLNIFDVTPLAIGVKVDDEVEHLIGRNQTVPCSESKIFKTQSADQTEVHLEIFEGNSIVPENCVELGKAIIPFPRSDKQEEVKVTLKIDMDGILSVHGTVNGVEKEIELINIFAGESKKQKQMSNQPKKVQRWVRFARTLEAEKRELLEELINRFVEGEDVENQIHTFLKDNKTMRGKGILSEVEIQRLNAIKSGIEAEEEDAEREK